MNKRIDLDALIFDPVQWLPPEIGAITNHQTDLPRIAKDPKLTALIEGRPVKGASVICF